MTDIEAMKAVTARGVEAFATIETAVRTIVQACRDLESVYQDGHALGMAKGGVVSKQIAEFDRWVGDMGEFGAKVYAAHERSTAIAKANDADTVLPATYAPLATTDGSVTIMGGGDR